SWTGGDVSLRLVGFSALAIGAIVRTPAAATAWSAAIFSVTPPLMNVLPASWNHAITKYLPSEAGRQLFSLTHDSNSLAPVPGGLLFAGYCAFAIALAAVLLVRRDT